MSPNPRFQRILVTTVNCPTCGKPVELTGEQRSQHTPFCSKRCRLVDLGAWADGRYVVPGMTIPPDIQADQ